MNSGNTSACYVNCRFRFSVQQVFCMYIQASFDLAPSVGTFDNELDDVMKLYKERLPSHDVIDQKVRLSKIR